MAVRHLFIVGAALGVVGAALAVNPVPRARSAVTPQLAREADEFARQLEVYLRRIHEGYVREIDPVALYLAAFAGLHEAARQPVPPDLRASFAQALTDANAPAKCLDLCRRIREDLGDVDAIRGRQAIIVCLKSLPRALDPHCGLTAPGEFRGAWPIEPEYGTGIDFSNAPGPATLPQAALAKPTTMLPSAVEIRSVRPGSPGQRAGLRPGDLVTHVDGRACDQIDPRRFIQTFFPSVNDEADDASYRVMVRRPGEHANREITLSPGRYYAETVYGARRRTDGSWDYLFDAASRIGYIRVGPLENWTDNELHDAVTDLQSADVRGIILDVRWCPGGFVHKASAVARTFLPGETPIASVASRPTADGRRAIRPVEEEFPRTTLDPTTPLLALVGRETIGGGELIAAALQDQGRAWIAGERTFGKATVQRSIEFNEGPGIDPLRFKLTTGDFLRISGQNLQRRADSRPTDDWGVRPDPGRWLPTSPEVARQLKEWWIWQSLRPGGSRDVLPTDEPESDPQLLGAFQMIKALTAGRS